jgi:hypothetical protein
VKKLLLLLLLLAGAAHAQSVQQSGSVTPNHVPVWTTNGVIQDGGTASSGLATSFGVTNNGGPGICVNSAPITGPYNALCLSASTSGAGQITLQNYGGAVAQNLQIVVNGTVITVPTGGGSTFPTIITPLVINDVVCASTTNGVLKDCGVNMGPGTQWGVQYFSTAATTTSTSAGTNGQVFLGQTGAAPIWSTLSGDVSSVSAAGALTLARVNGIPFPFSFTVHGVLLGEGINQFTSLVTSNVGQCLLSQGVNTDPIWGACASGSGSAGGSNTQIQYNSSTSLAGSPNLTWVSPTLTLGFATNATGQLALAGSTSGAVTIQSQAAAGTYNFNLPTSAGSSGQPLISGGGAGAAQTYGTLGIFGGGTNCTSASGTCLDNITGFAATGFVQRTGAGTYALSNPIPVANGGTNLANGTSGGILGFTGASTIASSALLTLNGVVVGGGSGATPTSTAAGTNGQLLLGQTSAAPAWETAGGDIATVSAAGVFTIAANAVTVGKMAQVGAKALLGNATGSTANVTATGYTASSTDGTIAAVHGTITSGDIAKFNDTVGTLADAGYSVSLGSTGQLAYWSSGTAIAGENIASALTQGTGITLSGTTNVTIALSTPVSLANGGTAQTSALSARASSGLNIDECTSTGDANYSIASTDRCVYHTALSAARTDTLPAANSVNAGQVFYLTDFAGVASATHTITLQRAGSDTINGVTSVVAANAQYGAGIFWSDGSTRWTYFPASTGGGGGGTITSVGIGAGISSTAAAGGTTAITTSGSVYLDASFVRDYIAGVTLSNDGTSPNSVLDTSAGVVTDSTNAYLIKIGAFTKSTAGAWASGSGSNGMGNGLTVAASTWYHVCVAYNGGTPDEWFDTSPVCANAPSGVANPTIFRRIGSFKTDASSHILAFSQNGDEFLWSVSVQDINGSQGTTTTNYILSVPTGVVVWAKIRAVFFSGSTAGNAILYPLAQSTQVANSPAGNSNFSWNTTTSEYNELRIRTNTTSQIGAVASAASISVNVVTFGWDDPRGRYN